MCSLDRHLALGIGSVLKQRYLEFLACLHRLAEKELVESQFDEQICSQSYKFKDLEALKLNATEDGLLRITKAGKITVIEVAPSTMITKVSKEPPF